MKTFNREEGGKLWEAWWDAMEQEWFKVEVLQDYRGEDDSPSLAAWRLGKKEESLILLKNQGLDADWQKALDTKKHVKKLRFHIIEKPLSSYMEWEIEHYKIYNIPFGGEEIYLVPKEKVRHLQIPDGDFVIFDNKRVVKNTYDSTGKVVTYDFYEEGDDISQFLALKSELLKCREPLP